MTANNSKCQKVQPKYLELLKVDNILILKIKRRQFLYSCSKTEKYIEESNITEIRIFRYISPSPTLGNKIRQCPRRANHRRSVGVLWVLEQPPSNEPKKVRFWGEKKLFPCVLYTT